MSAGFTSEENYDKIGFSVATSQTPVFSNASWTNYSEVVYTYPHSMGEQPAPEAIFSLDGTNYLSSGENNYFQQVGGTGGAGYYYVVGFVDADATNIYVTIGSNYNTSKLVYFKIIGEYKQ